VPELTAVDDAVASLDELADAAPSAPAPPAPLALDALATAAPPVPPLVASELEQASPSAAISVPVASRMRVIVPPEKRAKSYALSHFGARAR
jgi:hypothetical protein